MRMMRWRAATRDYETEFIDFPARQKKGSVFLSPPVKPLPAHDVWALVLSLEYSDFMRRLSKHSHFFFFFFQKKYNGFSSKYPNKEF